MPSAAQTLRSANLSRFLDSMALADHCPARDTLENGDALGRYAVAATANDAGRQRNEVRLYDDVREAITDSVAQMTDEVPVVPWRMVDLDTAREYAANVAITFEALN